MGQQPRLVMFHDSRLVRQLTPLVVLLLVLCSSRVGARLPAHRDRGVAAHDAGVL
jgi:hypothetical protein